MPSSNYNLQISPTVDAGGRERGMGTHRRPGVAASVLRGGFYFSFDRKAKGRNLPSRARHAFVLIASLLYFSSTRRAASSLRFSSGSPGLLLVVTAGASLDDAMSTHG